MKSKIHDKNENSNLIKKINDCKDIASLKILLKSLVNKNSDFDWIKPILEKTTSDFLKQYLQRNSPDPTRLHILDLESNLTEAANLMSRCLSQYQEILSLETAAISSALDLKVSVELGESDKIFSMLGMNAQRKIAKYDASKHPLEEDVDSRLAIGSSAIKYRLMLHNQPGNSLNFGERVLFLREILGNTLRAASEFMICADHALKVCYKIVGPESPQYENEFSLQQMMLWIRGAVRALETVKAQETTHIHIVDWIESEPDDEINKRDIKGLGEWAWSGADKKEFGVFRVSIDLSREKGRSFVYDSKRAYRLSNLSGALTINVLKLPDDLTKVTPEQKATFDMQLRKYELTWLPVSITPLTQKNDITINNKFIYKIPRQQLQPFPVIHNRPIFSAINKSEKQTISNHPIDPTFIIALSFMNDWSNSSDLNNDRAGARKLFRRFKQGRYTPNEEYPLKRILFIFEIVSSPAGIKLEVN